MTYQRVYYTVEDVEEINETEFNKMKKDERKLLANTDNYYVWSVGEKRVMYARDGKKFYRGEMDTSQTITELTNAFDYGGVMVQKPYVYFMRKDKDETPAPAPAEPTTTE